MSQPSLPGQLLAGRYVMYDAIASGGMATVHYGRLVGPVGFSRTVAIKRLHPALANDPDFASTFLDEARLAARVRHPNVVSVLDVVSDGGELLLIMEYVHGETLSRLTRAASRLGERMPLPVAIAIATGVLQGLHAAHEATSESGEPLGIVHRDVSPQNILVGADGAPHLVDFGIAKAAGRTQTTRDGQLKGKLPYMAVEQLRGQKVTRRTDVYAASVVLWELLVGERLFKGEDAAVYGAVIEANPPRPIEIVPELPRSIDELVMRGLSADPNARFASAREMALELERAIRPATASEVGAWVESVAAEVLTQRSRRLAEIESRGSDSLPPPALADPSGAISADTQLSSISVSRSNDERSRRPRRVAIWAGGAALLVLLAAAVTWKLSPSTGAQRPESALGSGVRSEPAPSSPPVVVLQSAEAPAASTPASAAPSAPRPLQRRAPTRSTTKTPPTSKGCKYLGPDGIWHIRPECL